MFDMKIHNPESHQALLDLDISKIWSELRAELQGLEDAEHRDYGGYPYPNLPIVVSGYDAASYGYVR